MRDPDKARREAEVYRRLLAGLSDGTVSIPDEAARETVEAMSSAFDEAHEYAEIVLEHDALHGLAALLGGGRE